MSEHIFKASDARDHEIKVLTYSHSNVVSVKADIGIRFDLSDAMKLIVENWSSFDERERQLFARKVGALDARDSERLLGMKKSEDEDEEDFKW